MKKFKKVFAVILSVIFLFSSISMMSYAFQDDEFNIESITWDDIMTMSNADFKVLLANFERVYDPLGTYKTNPLAQGNNKHLNFGVQPI